jgi:hypothetical protein
MMITPNLNDGESYVEGRSEETARKLFEAADKAGIDTSLISTSSHGYVVPKELAGKLGDVEVKQAGDQPAVPTEPGTTTNPDEAWNAEAWKREQEAVQADNDSAVAKVEAERPEEASNGDDGQFNPADHTVEEVKEYLDGADDAERDRVIAAEEASEKPRRGILKLADEEEEGDK